MEIFVSAIFIMLQKNAFGQKKFQISCKGSKVPFWQNRRVLQIQDLCRKKYKKGDFLKKGLRELIFVLGFRFL